MKTNFKTAVMALALVASVTTVFATKIVRTPNKLLPTYNWTDVNNSNPIFGKTVPEAIEHYGCETGHELCATGVPTAGGEDQLLKKN